MPRSDKPDLRALDAISDEPPRGSEHDDEHSSQTIVLPDSVSMVSLLGPGDQLLRTMERAFPTITFSRCS